MERRLFLKNMVPYKKVEEYKNTRMLKSQVILHKSELATLFA